MSIGYAARRIPSTPGPSPWHTPGSSGGVGLRTHEQGFGSNMEEAVRMRICQGKLD